MVGFLGSLVRRHRHYIAWLRDACRPTVAVSGPPIEGSFAAFGSLVIVLDWFLVAGCFPVFSARVASWPMNLPTNFHHHSTCRRQRRSSFQRSGSASVTRQQLVRRRPRSRVFLFAWCTGYSATYESTITTAWSFIAWTGASRRWRSRMRTPAFSWIARLSQSMRGIDHEWHSRPDLYYDPERSVCPRTNRKASNHTTEPAANRCYNQSCDDFVTLLAAARALARGSLSYSR